MNFFIDFSISVLSFLNRYMLLDLIVFFWMIIIIYDMKYVRFLENIAKSEIETLKERH